MKKDYRELVVCNKKEIPKLERFVEEICDYYNINKEYFGNILLATTEATCILFSLNNEKGTDEILISFERTPKGLIFKIRLGEKEYNIEDMEDDLDREIRKHKLSKEIFIVKALADEITISINAKSIILVFYVTSMNYEKSLQRINKLKEYWGKKVTITSKNNEGAD
ncbi:MAG: hypothetical protein M0Q38_00645 [Bacteroidales bacterium]|jgi:hypothetical protein|nr:hypothetical protein [Bacteroidales bacterium]